MDQYKKIHSGESTIIMTTMVYTICYHICIL